MFGLSNPREPINRSGSLYNYAHSGTHPHSSPNDGDSHGTPLSTLYESSAQSQTTHQVRADYPVKRMSGTASVYSAPKPPRMPMLFTDQNRSDDYADSRSVSGGDENNDHAQQTGSSHGDDAAAQSVFKIPRVKLSNWNRKSVVAH